MFSKSKKQKVMKKLIVLFAVFSTLDLSAQTRSKTSTWEFEVDPLAYAFFKGYSGHVRYNQNKIVWDAGVYGLEVPESVHGNQGFQQKMTGFGIKTSYLFNNVKGLYTGVGFGYTATEATYLQAKDVKAKGKSIGGGVHLGYRFFLQKEKNGTRKGIYIAPWVGLDYNFHIKEVKFDNMNFKQNNLSFFPTVHIGYRL
jgi:hypothetical protein